MHRDYSFVEPCLLRMYCIADLTEIGVCGRDQKIRLPFLHDDEAPTSLCSCEALHAFQDSWAHFHFSCCCISNTALYRAAPIWMDSCSKSYKSSLKSLETMECYSIIRTLHSDLWMECAGDCAIEENDRPAFRRLIHSAWRLVKPYFFMTSANILFRINHASTVTAVLHYPCKKYRLELNTSLYTFIDQTLLPMATALTIDAARRQLDSSNFGDNFFPCHVGFFHSICRLLIAFFSICWQSYYMVHSFRAKK